MKWKSEKYVLSVWAMMFLAIAERAFFQDRKRQIWALRPVQVRRGVMGFTKTTCVATFLVSYLARQRPS